MFHFLEKYLLSSEMLNALALVSNIWVGWQIFYAVLPISIYISNQLLIKIRGSFIKKNTLIPLQMA